MMDERGPKVSCNIFSEKITLDTGSSLLKKQESGMKDEI